MSYISIYRKFRPITFDKVIGQEHIVRTLKNIIKNDKIGHAYLFTGTRGTGKTSCAKIFAKAVNCLNPIDGSPCNECEVCKGLTFGSNLDIIELDAASNNSVDDIRAIKESLQFAPALGKYKVYIIDEVHMLTISAFNALLKSLEEPPPYVIFILATTEVHKLPDTILSRCVRFDFRLLAEDDLVGLLKTIFGELNYPYEIKALREIALSGQGSVRDTLSIADMCMSFAPDGLTFKDVLDVLGAQEFDTIYDLAVGILNGKVDLILKITHEIYKNGKGISTINKELLNFFRDLISIKNIVGYKGNFSDEEYKIVSMLSDKFDNYRFSRVLEMLAGIENQLRYSTMPIIVFEATLIKASQTAIDVSTEGLTSRVNELEAKLKDSSFISKIRDNLVATATEISEKPANIVEASKAIDSAIEKLEAVNEDKVFEDIELDQNVEQAFALLNTVIMRLNDMKYVFFASSLGEIEKCSIQDNILTLRLEDETNLACINEEKNFKLLTELVKKEKGENFSVLIEDGLKKKKENFKDRLNVIELFGNKLKKQ